MMRYPVLAAALCGLFTSAIASASVLVDFASAGQLDGAFNHPASMNQAATGGTGNGGSVQLTAVGDVTATYKTGTFGPIDSTGVRVSVDFHLTGAPTGGGRVAQIGLGAASDNGFTTAGSMFVSARLDTSGTNYTLVAQQRNASTLTSDTLVAAFPLSLATDPYYRLQVDLTRTSLNNYKVSASLMNLGIDGTSTPTTVQSFSPASYTNTVIESSSLYAAFRGNKQTGVEYFDNFSVGAIPEPAGMASLGAAVGLLARRRR